MSALDLKPTGNLVVYEGPFTIADRDAVPENGYRHELLDGMLVMQASPRARHQGIVLSIATLLRAAAPREMRVLVSPFDVRRDDTTAIQPDVVVARRADVNDEGWTDHPVLCVEVASPSTRVLDLGDKKDVLARIGCPTYWTIEPYDGADSGPELTAWELRGEEYAEFARVSGPEPWSTDKPFPVTITPADLADD